MHLKNNNDVGNTLRHMAEEGRKPPKENVYFKPLKIPLVFALIHLADSGLVYAHKHTNTQLDTHAGVGTVISGREILNLSGRQSQCKCVYG